MISNHELDRRNAEVYASSLAGGFDTGRVKGLAAIDAVKEFDRAITSHFFEQGKYPEILSHDASCQLIRAFTPEGRQAAIHMLMKDD